MSIKAIIVLAEGFEETEAVVPIDILRRAGIDVSVASLDTQAVKGAHEVVVNADMLLNEIKDLPDAIIFPGGMPGASNLAASPELREIVSKMNDEGRLIAAICATPAVFLGPAGVLEGKQATCYPSMETDFPDSVVSIDEDVVQDGNIITSKGPGTASEFAFKIVEYLTEKEKAISVREDMLFN